MEKIDNAMRDELAPGDSSIEKTNTTWDDSNDIDPDLDKRITRKFDTHVVPWLFGLWLLAFIDRRYFSGCCKSAVLIAYCLPVISEMQGSMDWPQTCI